MVAPTISNFRQLNKNLHTRWARVRLFLHSHRTGFVFFLLNGQKNRISWSVRRSRVQPKSVPLYFCVGRFLLFFSTALYSWFLANVIRAIDTIQFVSILKCTDHCYRAEFNTYPQFCATIAYTTHPHTYTHARMRPLTYKQSSKRWAKKRRPRTKRLNWIIKCSGGSIVDRKWSV